MNSVNVRMFFILLVVGAAFLAMPLTTAQAQSHSDILSVFPDRLESWVEVKADSIVKAQDLAKETALTQLDSIATAQGAKIDTENVAFKTTYLGIWSEEEGSGRRKKIVQKGFKVRMKAIVPILKE